MLFDFRPKDIRVVGDWEQWFAWHPARLERGLWVWLQNVERRLIRPSIRHGHTWDEYYEYRLIGTPDKKPSSSPVSEWLPPFNNDGEDQNGHQ